MDALNLQEALELMFDSGDISQHLDSSRNNFQISLGFSSQNQKKDPVNGVYEAMPQLNNNTDKFMHQFVVMSDLARLLKLDFVDILESNAHKAHLDVFAQKIHAQNLFPGCTVSLYTDPSQLLTIHTDDFNATQEGHNVQMVASELMLGKHSQLQRVFIAVYGRACCHQYLVCEKQSDELVVA